jgi:hypothetical protein
VGWNLLDVAGGGGERASVVAVAFAAPALGTLSVLRLKLGRHLLLHDLFEHAFNGFSDAVFEGIGDGVEDIVVGHLNLVGLTHKKRYTTSAMSLRALLMVCSRRAARPHPR